MRSKASIAGLFAAVLLTTTLFALPQATFAQTASVPSSDIAARRAQLQAQLDSLNAQIAQTQSTLNTLHGQHKTLQGDINILTAGIKQAQLQVQATQLQIQALAQNITLHTSTITQLSSKITSEQQSVAEIIRQTNEIDNSSLVVVALSAQNISSFFSDLDTFTALKQQLGASSALLSSTKDATEKEKTQLVDQATQKKQLAQLQATAEQQIVTQQAQKKKLLALTASQESNYQTTLTTQQKTAAQIRAELFALAGGSGAIPFGTAADDAKIASKITGVRAALILAILSQESDLGKNVGQCLVTDLTTGDGKGKNTGTPFSGVMKSPRDTTVFASIMNALGRDWSTTPVSCPQLGGYGGAMGPTQFIPSTWALYEDSIKSALNVAATDPWNALHAITATGLYLADVGAAGGDSTAEHTAAAKYYAGSGWATSGQIYANSVMAKAANFQADINTLNGG